MPNNFQNHLVGTTLCFFTLNWKKICCSSWLISLISAHLRSSDIDCCVFEFSTSKKSSNFSTMCDIKIIHSLQDKYRYTCFFLLFKFLVQNLFQFGVWILEKNEKNILTWWCRWVAYQYHLFQYRLLYQPTFQWLII